MGAIEYDFLYKGTVATTGIDIQRLRKVELKKKVRDSVLKKQTMVYLVYKYLVLVIVFFHHVRDTTIRGPIRGKYNKY